MSSLRKLLVGCVAAGALLPTALHAQTVAREPPESVSLRLGPLALAPTFTLNNMGWDSNVFQRPLDAEPVGDFVWTVRPDVQGWLRLGRARVAGRGTVDYAYFRNHPGERSVDTAYEGVMEVPLQRVTLYASADSRDARQRLSFEIDHRLRRREKSNAGGLILRVGGRTSIDVSVGRSRLEFNQPEDFQNPLISDLYDQRSRRMAVTLRRDLTPLTAVAVTVHKHRDRFDLGPELNSGSFTASSGSGISSGLEFRPFALLTGRAFVGWDRVELAGTTGSSFRGLVTAVDLAYTLLGTTRFTVQAERGLSYSATRGQHAFLLAGVRGSVVRRMGNHWDIGGRLGRYRASYDVFELSTQPGSVVQTAGFDRGHDTATNYGGQLGYSVGPDMRVGFHVDRYRRRSATEGRQYNVTRAGMSLTYRF